MSAALSEFEKNFESHLEDLKQLVRIPSISFAGFDPAQVKKSASAVAALMKRRGLENVEIIDFPGAHPYVYGDWLHAEGAPTLLLYAHHDVQPVGREEVWKTKPFEPTVAEGPEGLRLWGRGSADDKAGIIIHTSAIASYLDAVKKLPVNVKVLIEGEEEVGSTHLEAFLQQYKKKLSADCLVLTDTSNFDCGIPSLTVSLRGLVGLEVELHALTKTVHSGMWGGPVPDPAMALAKMLATLTDKEGKIAVPGVLEGWIELTPQEEAEYRALPFDEKKFKAQSGLRDEVPLLRQGPSPWAQIWRYPSLTVNAMQASSRSQAGNIINDLAWAYVTIRMAPGMKPDHVLTQLKKYLQSQVPWGLTLKFSNESTGSPWMTNSREPSARWAFDAADRAMEAGYGQKPVHIGCGGTIPFVKPFAAALGGVPALLVGVEDPYTNAHGENESLLLSDFESACRSQVHLFEMLGEAWKNRRH